MKKFFKGMIAIRMALTGLMLTASAQQHTRGYDPAIKKSIGHQKNLYEINTGVYRSAQPGERALVVLKKAGIREILNLRRHKNKDSRLANPGDFILHLVSLKACDINEDSLIEALRVIRNRQSPILIHCWKGSDRTGWFVRCTASFLITGPRSRLSGEIEDGGFGFHKMYHQVPAYIRQADIPRIRQLLSE